MRRVLVVRREQSAATGVGDGLSSVPSAHSSKQRRQLCIDLIQEIRTIKGVQGVHVMAYRQEHTVAEIIERSGVLNGRKPWYPGRDPQANTNRMAS